MLFTTIKAVLGSEPMRQAAKEILEAIADSGDKKARLQAIEQSGQIMEYQNVLVLELAASLEEEGRETLTLAEAALLMIQLNAFAFRTIKETADLDKKNG